MPDRIVDPGAEPPLLFLLPHLEPDLDEMYAAVDDELLDDRTKQEKPLMLFGSAESHDVFHSGPIVPTAVEDHDLPARGKALDVSLHIHL